MELNYKLLDKLQDDAKGWVANEELFNAEELFIEVMEDVLFDTNKL